MRIKILLARVVELCFAALIPGGFLATVSFITAITPEQALSAGQNLMPLEWEAGVWSKGHYYQWLTIRHHPFLFLLSVVSIFIGGYGLNWVQKNWTFQMEGKQTDAPKGPNPLFFATFLILSLTLAAMMNRVPHGILKMNSYSWVGISMVITVLGALLGARGIQHYYARKHDDR